MPHPHSITHLRIVTACLLAVVAALGLGACSETAGPDEGTTVEDVQEEPELAYEGDYNAAFYEGMGEYEGEVVTLSADVSQVIAEHAFTIAGGDVEELLVVSAEGASGLEPGSLVKVTGKVRTAFDLPVAEGELGVELEDELLVEHEEEPYVEAIEVVPDAGEE